MFFPDGSITTETTISGNTNYVLVNNTNQKWILNVRMQQAGTDSETHLNCGNVAIAKNYARDFPQELMQRQCNDIIQIVKTGQDEAFVSITYFEGSLTPTPTPTNTPGSSEIDYFSITNPNDPAGNFKIGKVYSYGEIVITFLLISLFFILIFNTIKDIVVPAIIRIRKKI